MYLMTGLVLDLDLDLDLVIADVCHPSLPMSDHWQTALLQQGDEEVAGELEHGGSV